MGGRNEKTFPPIRNTERSAKGLVLRPALIILVLIMLMVPLPGRAQQASVITSTGNPPTFTFSFGTVDALAVNPGNGNVPSGNVAALSNGALYFFTYSLTVNGLQPNKQATVTGSITTSFNHSPSALVIENCPNTSNCNLAASYSPFTTNPVVSPSISGNGQATVTAGFGLFVPDNNGSTAFTGTDSAVVTLTATDANKNKISSALVSFTPQTLQSAVKLSLASTVAGFTSSGPNSSFNFGTVNGLGIGTGTVAPLPIANLGSDPAIYPLPYTITPAFSDQNTTAAKITVSVSSNFSHSGILTLEDSPSGSTTCPAGLTYTPIARSPSTTTITTTAADRTAINRCLGLFVSPSGGILPGFSASDSATLTYTITVQ
jgi:hypothetical protein